MAAPGDRYDRFIVEEILGRGGMATVYRARHETLGSAHALKVLDLPFPSIRARLIQEGQVQARLRHPHIVAVTDLIDVDGSPGLIMEYVGGPTLDAWIQRNRADARTATSIFQGVLDAVAFAHREGVVHRDLKPGNVLLHTVDGRIFPKVTDFGLAKLLTGSGTDHHTRTGFAMGTPGYMAPEQVRSAKDVDARTDIFALGCILYELWCGIPAFPGKDIFATLELMEASRYTDPRAQRPDIPEAVSAAIRGMLEPDRSRRLPNCEAIRAVMNPRSVAAPVSPATQAVWGGGEGVGSAVDVLAPRVPTPAPIAEAVIPIGAPHTFDPHLPPASLFETRATTSRATTMGAAAGVGVMMMASVATVLVCAGIAWGVWRNPPPVEVVTPSDTVPAPVVDAPPVDAAPAPEPSATPAAVVRPADTVRPRPVDGSPGSTTRPSGAAPIPPAGAPAPTPAATSAVAPGPTAAASPTASPTASTSPTAAVGSPSASPPAATTTTPTPTGRLQVAGDADAVWIESQGRRFGAGTVAPGSYTLHARWGTVEVERKVTVSAGQTLLVTCDANFFNCSVR